MKRNARFLWIIFFLIIFINGFESGGYQASLLDIGKNYDLNNTSKGLTAAVELFADMLAPILLGAWADRNDKVKCLRIALIIQIAVTLGICLPISRNVFVMGMFLIGLTTSTLQFITIAAFADIYPMSSKKRIGYMTSMYAFGAFVAPLIVTFYLKCGLSWKTLFIIIAVASALSFAYMQGITDKVQEKIENITKERDKKGFILSGVLLLCLVMAIYVGFENGFAFFIDSMFSEELASTLGKFAISIFWIVMIPSRMLVGSFEKYSRKILLVSVIAIPAITVLISTLNSAKLILMLCVPLGFFSGAIYPCSLNLAMPLSGKSKALATGMITTATGLGGFIFTAITGILGNYIGLRTAIMLLATPFVFSLLAVLILIFNKSYKYINQS